MIAAFKVLLPFELNMAAQPSMNNLLAKVGDIDIEIYPPYQSQITESDLSVTSEVPLTEMIARLGRNATPQPNPNVRIDGKPTFMANAIAINFRKADFDRNIPTVPGPPKVDPPIELVFSILNRLLGQMRQITKAPFIKLAAPETSIWRIDYFNDDATQLKVEEGKLRGHMTTGFQWKYCAVSQEVWMSLVELPYDRTMPVWESLYLDALDLLPDFGPSIVLAFSSIEVLIAQVLNHHAREKVSPFGLWEWLNDRNQYWREPSMVEKMDRVLRELVGISAKDDPSRWKAFSELKQARDSFVHTGTIAIGRPVIDPVKLHALVVQAKYVIDWLSGYLPKEQRSYQPGYTISVESLRRLT